jgi:putative membrane protein
VTEPTQPAPRRFPRRVYGVGTEPDARFSLANERTFLAWIRTALALIAAGVALEAFVMPIAPGFRLGASILLTLLGVLAPIQAWLGWLKAEQSLRLGRPLPFPNLAGPIGGGVFAVVGIVAPPQTFWTLSVVCSSSGQIRRMLYVWSSRKA